MSSSDPLRHSHRHAIFLLASLLIAAFFIFSSDCPAQTKPSSRWSRDSLLSAARQIMTAQQYCGLITVDSSGQPHARTMNPFRPEDDMTVWMATNSRSRKAAEIRKHSQVCLYYADHTKATGLVTIYGKAVLVDEMSEKLKRKRAYWDQAFPDWKYLLLIKVIPQRLEVLNYSRGMVNDSVTWEIPAVEFAAP